VRAFEVVGLLSFRNPGKYQVLVRTIPDLKEKARGAGANAIIIDRSEPVKSGLTSTGISVTGRAIRVEPVARPPRDHALANVVATQRATPNPA
jgi:hypothetical protein